MSDWFFTAALWVVGVVVPLSLLVMAVVERLRDDRWTR